jgi:integrase
MWIHRILDQALREGRVRQNVAAFADRPRYQRREMRFLTGDEVARLMKASAGTWYAPLFALALATGARRGELLALKWEDVDFPRALLSIKRALESTRRYGVREKSTKSGKPRAVDLPASALDMLRRHRLASALDRIGPGYIFPGPNGGPWDPNKISQHFRHFRYLAKLKGASFHSLRHTAATQMLELGISPKVVQERLGHGSISITMDLYSHSTPSLQADAARRLDTTLAPLLSVIGRK